MAYHGSRGESNMDKFSSITYGAAIKAAEEILANAAGVTDEVITEKTNSAVTQYLSKPSNLDDAGIVTTGTLLKSITSHINVLWYGLDNTGEKDNADLLQTILDSVPNGTTLYFPTGEYLLSHGVTVNKSIQLLGDRKGRYLAANDSAKIHGSCLKFMDSVSNATMITQGNDCWSLTMYNLILLGNSGKFYDDGLNDETIPYAEYRYEVINENVNGVLCVHSTDISDCSFCAFSGYGLSNAQAQNINQCMFYGNGIGIYVAKNDIMLRDCYITAGKTGIYCPGSKNIMIFGCYLDLFAEHAIYCESYLSGFINAYIDHTIYSGIHADTLNNIFVIANIHRTGMYYSGKTIDDLKVSDNAADELENFRKASAISCSKTLKSTFQLGANSKSNDDAGTSNKSSPILALYVTQAYTSILIGAEMDVYVRVFNTSGALTLIGNKGVFCYSNAIIRSTPNLVIKSYSPSAGSKAQDIGDIWYNSYKKELYMATAVTDLSTTWEKQYMAKDIDALEARIAALESK